MWAVTAVITLAEKPTLVGERVLLRPVGAADADGLLELTSDQEVTRLTGSHPGRPMGRDTLMEWYGSRGDHAHRLDLAIIDRSTDAYVGEAVLNELDVENGSCNFRIALVGPRAFGRGYGTEATRLILAHGFETVGLHRIELQVFDFNPRARRLYDNVGFVHEGTRRDALRWDGAWVDAHDMSILADEWRQHRGHPVDYQMQIERSGEAGL